MPPLFEALVSCCSISASVCLLVFCFSDVTAGDLFHFFHHEKIDAPCPDPTAGPATDSTAAPPTSASAISTITNENPLEYILLLYHRFLFFSLLPNPKLFRLSPRFIPN